MAAYFPSTGAYLVQNYTAAEPTSFSVSFWFYMRPDATAFTYRVIFGLNYGLEIGTFSDASADTAYQNFGTNTADFAGPLLKKGVWYHMAASSEGISSTNHIIRGYLNGVPVASGVDTGAYGTNATLSIGNYGNNLYPTYSNVRDVRIWNRVVSASEFKDEYESAKPVHRQKLIVWSPLDDDLYTDKSGNGRVWTQTDTGILLVNGGPRKVWPSSTIKGMR